MEFENDPIGEILDLEKRHENLFIEHNLLAERNKILNQRKNNIQPKLDAIPPLANHPNDKSLENLFLNSDRRNKLFQVWTELYDENERLNEIGENLK